MSVVVDTSALFALLDGRDANHVAAVGFWTDPDDEDLVVHAYVVIETLALVRSRLGQAAVAALVDDLLPAIRGDGGSPAPRRACWRSTGGWGGRPWWTVTSFAARHGSSGRLHRCGPGRGGPVAGERASRGRAAEAVEIGVSRGHARA